MVDNIVAMVGVSQVRSVKRSGKLIRIYSFVHDLLSHFYHINNNDYM